GDEVLAFCGPSGVGKTTLAQSFAGRGCPLVSEDLVLVALDGAGPEVILAGESAVRGWAGRHAAAFAAGAAVRTGDLARDAGGPRWRLSGEGGSRSGPGRGRRLRPRRGRSARRLGGQSPAPAGPGRRRGRGPFRAGPGGSSCRRRPGRRPPSGWPGAGNVGTP